MKKKTVLLISLIMFIVVEIIILYYFKDRAFVSDNDINIDKNSNLVKKLYDMVNPSNDAILLDELYKNKDLTSKYIVAMGINNYLKYNEIKKFNNNDITGGYINESDVRDNIKYVLGNISYKNTDVYIMRDNYCMFKYNNELSRYELVGGCDGSYTGYYRVIDSAYVNDNKLYIREKLIYYTYDFNEVINKVSIYDNPDMINILDYREISSYDEINYLDNFIDKGSIYLYEFEKVDNNNNYIFKKITRLK